MMMCRINWFDGLAWQVAGWVVGQLLLHSVRWRHPGCPRDRLNYKYYYYSLLSLRCHHRAPVCTACQQPRRIIRVSANRTQANRLTILQRTGYHHLSSTSLPMNSNQIWPAFNIQSSRRFPSSELRNDHASPRCLERRLKKLATYRTALGVCSCIRILILILGHFQALAILQHIHRKKIYKSIRHQYQYPKCRNPLGRQEHSPDSAWEL